MDYAAAHGRAREYDFNLRYTIQSSCFNRDDDDITCRCSLCVLIAAILYTCCASFFVKTAVATRAGVGLMAVIIDDALSTIKFSACGKC